MERIKQNSDEMNNFEPIQTIICLGEGISPEILKTKTRQREIVEARYIIFYFDKQTSPKKTFSAIAKPFGKDHATALHGIKKITNLNDTDKKFAAKLALYQRRINELMNFQNNICVDKILEIKNYIRKCLDSNEIIKYESVVIYNNLLGKSPYKP